ncbi:hypothetical protein G7046_g4056 [Stylonectria norvegica]|nr:hypothetical protein G7046_g4056 [Stylonectria norvegica]
MNSSQAALRRASLCSPARNSVLSAQRQWVRNASNSPRGRGRKGGKLFAFTAVFGAAAAGAYYYPNIKEQFAPEPPAEIAPRKAEAQFEKARKKAQSKEENRDIISSQHTQVKNSWEKPGVYAWGSNSSKVIDPNSNERYVKLPRRISYFDGQLLRDLKLTQTFGAAVTEDGDLVQWGLGYNKTDAKPVPTLKGKDLIKIDVSADRIIALSCKGKVYSIPASRNDQEGGIKEEQQQSSWSLWGSAGAENISFRNLTPSELINGENITDISSGLEHCLLLTSKGRVFSAASSTLEFPSRGQMGIPGLSWTNRPKGPYDQPHEIKTLRGFEISQLAAGAYHSVVLDKLGRVFTFGDNSFGQLGFDTDFGVQLADAPAMIPLNKLYGSGGLIPSATLVAAGGYNTFFTVDAKAPPKFEDATSLAPARRLPQVTCDVWGCGQGVYGSLGTGKWSHVSSKPSKVKALSSLFEFDEKTNKMSPIRLKSLSIGSTHCSAVMDNVTETDISANGSENDTNWGADVVFWGGNEHFQLGTGKRTNSNAPIYIGPLDGAPKDEFHRLHVTPRKTVRLGEGGKGRKVSLEQKVECGKFVTSIYSSAGPGSDSAVFSALFRHLFSHRVRSSSTPQQTPTLAPLSSIALIASGPLLPRPWVQVRTLTLPFLHRPEVCSRARCRYRYRFPSPSPFWSWSCGCSTSSSSSYLRPRPRPRPRLRRSDSPSAAHFASSSSFFSSNPHLAPNSFSSTLFFSVPAMDRIPKFRRKPRNPTIETAVERSSTDTADSTTSADLQAQQQQPQTQQTQNIQLQRPAPP